MTVPEFATDLTQRLQRHARLSRLARIANAAAWTAFVAALAIDSGLPRPVLRWFLLGAFVVAAVGSIILRYRARRLLGA